MKFVALLLFGASLYAADLQIYAIDTEGGKSTLYVSPSGESMLVDTGYGGNQDRDADRIMAAMKSAGIDHIDHLILSHYHDDHSGGVKQLVAKIRVDHFYDHGPSVEGEKTSREENAWKAAWKDHPHTVLKPGDTVPVKGLDVHVIAANGILLEPASCPSPARPAVDNGENSRSVAMTITYGKFRAAEFGDLSADREYDLGCPGAKFGQVDLYMTTHHGTGASAPPQTLAVLKPRAAVMDNGAVKGGMKRSLSALHAYPGIADVWQLHYSNEGGEELNAAETNIANMSSLECKGFAIHVTAHSDSSFTVQNQRNGVVKTYPAR